MLCKNCNKKLTGRWKNFCSRRCGSLYYVKTHHKETDIERKLREWFETKQIKFDSQTSISNISVPDFLIGKIAVYADGDYWHNKPRRQYLDKRINNRLEKLGYTVVRFKGSEILKDFDKVTEKICQHIANLNNASSV